MNTQMSDMKSIFVLILASALINSVFGQNDNKSTDYFIGQNNNSGSYPNDQPNVPGKQNNLKNQTLFELKHVFNFSVTELNKKVFDEKFYFGPSFTIEPTDVIFDLSKSNSSTVIELRCLARGNPSPTYRWFKVEYMNENGLFFSLPIDPYLNERMTMNGGSLMIHKPQESDRGKYFCRASNKFGSIRSESISLSFAFIGDFNSTRLPEFGINNGGKVIHCNPPLSNLALNYSWNTDSFPSLVKDDQRIFTSADGSLYFSSLRVGDQLNYSCAIQSRFSENGKHGPYFPLFFALGYADQELTLASGFPKVFPKVPQAGKDIRLECVAHGGPLLPYQWLRYGAPLPHLARVENFGRVLIIPKATIKDEGKYICIADIGKKAVSNSVNVSIHAEPYFTIPLTNKSMGESSDMSWVCEAYGKPNVSYTWYRNGIILDQETLTPEFRDRYIIKDNILQIKNLDPEKDPAMFQCSAQNDVGTKISSAQLRVLRLPIYRKWEANSAKYASEESNVTLDCSPDESYRRQVTWTKDGIDIVPDEKMRISVNGDLFIISAARNDSGLYFCSSLKASWKDESTQRLAVIRYSKWSKPLPAESVVSAQQNLTLVCEADFDEHLDATYVWTRKGKKLIRDHRIVANKGSLLITNVKRADGGSYECTLDSSFEQITTRTLVIVNGKPGPPIVVAVQSTNTTSARIRWSEGPTNGRPIFKYRVSARFKGNPTWFRIADLTDVSTAENFIDRKEVILNNLYPGRTYQFRVAAFNALGRSKPSLPSPPYATQSDKPYKVPANIGRGDGHAGNLAITWKPLPLQDRNGPGIYYKVFWRRHLEELDFQSIEIKGNKGSAIIPIESDLFYTEYEVKVQAINDVGEGPISSIHYIMSADDKPLVTPESLSIKTFNSSAINVTWSDVPEMRLLFRGKLIGYRVKYWELRASSENAIFYDSRSTKTWALIGNLKPGSLYFVSVSAYNGAGHGPESDTHMVNFFYNSALFENLPRN